MADARVLRSLNQLVSTTHLTAKSYLTQPANSDVSCAKRSQIVASIDSIPSIVEPVITTIRQYVTLPRPEQTALEQAALSAEIRV